MRLLHPCSFVRAIQQESDGFRPSYNSAKACTLDDLSQGRHTQIVAVRQQHRPAPHDLQIFCAHWLVPANVGLVLLVGENAGNLLRQRACGERGAVRLCGTDVNGMM